VLIQPLGFASAVAKAAKELEFYLARLSPVTTRALPQLPGLPSDSDARIVLGMSDHLAGLGLGRLPAASESDDALVIIPKDGRLFLAGSNARSVLFAAYRLLEHLGVVFLRPGPGGEVVPCAKSLRLPTKPIREKASYRHRGICIEGYPRLEQVLALLDWMAKKKMNTFHLEFLNAGVYWDRGYQQAPEMTSAPMARRLTAADFHDIDDQVIAHARELGMRIHRGGHGWTAQVLGYPPTGWYVYDRPVGSDAKHAWMAQVNGVRGLFHGQPTNTELCYSNPAVRAAFADQVMVYARRHSETDYLHVWLSDSINNHCECSACAEKSPADWYLVLVNEIAARMKAEGLPMKVVYNVYFNTLWTPKETRVEQDNLAMQYGPITRCYAHSIMDATCGHPLPRQRPKLNEVKLPRHNRAAAGVAHMWKPMGFPDSLVFEYYRFEPIWFDHLGCDLTEVIYQDMQTYHSLGLQGVMSNDCIRAFYPTPCSASALADALWDRNLATGPHRKRIMAAAFGPYTNEVQRYLRGVARRVVLTNDAHRNMGGSAWTAGTVFGAEWASHRRRLEDTARLASDAKGRFAKLARSQADRLVLTSLEIVALHAEQVWYMAQAALAALDGSRSRLDRLRKSYRTRLLSMLERFAQWVDPKVAEPVEVIFRLADERMLSVPAHRGGRPGRSVAK
jgi:hypothetical protein